MLFNSFHFLLFFPLVTIVYFMMAPQWRWFWLLAASCYFYMAFVPVYILILGFTIIVDYYAGIFIENSEGNRRKWLLAISLVANIGILVVFKYFNFLNANWSLLLDHMGYTNPVPYLKILLPIGLSFHTFQAMSYTIEVYRGNQKAERHFGIYALYVMFYPQLVAGPIERPQNLLHQFYEKHSFNYERVVAGLRMMLWGFFMKVVIADTLAPAVDVVYNNPHHYAGLPLMVSTVFFSFQIYCDFAGYSLIALGTAKVMGFELMKNFDSPYFSKNIGEFWRRWHISLSTWFKDYVYIPLGGNRVSMPKWYRNLAIIFLISGIWHGANWTYVVWGALHGFYSIFYIALWKDAEAKSWQNSVAFRLASMLLVFILVSVAWVFFRARNVEEGWYIIAHFLSSSQGWGAYLSAVKAPMIVLDFMLIFLLLLTEWSMKQEKAIAIFQNRPSLRLASYFIVQYAIVFKLFYGDLSPHQFIYFQF
ncbi:MAG: MBOAT family O-acyltransferase [Cytophagaceae bacterium]